MGKKSSPSPPPAPDPWETARADATFNRIDQYTPFGSLTFAGPNRNAAHLNLTPEMEAIINQRLGLDSELLSQGLGRLMGFDPNQIDLGQFGPIRSDAGLQQFDPSSLGLPDLPGDLGAFRNRIEDSIFQRGRRLLEPQFARQEESLRQTLANQGLPSTGDAFLDQFDQFNTNRGQTFQNLADAAVMGGGQEASRLLGDTLASRQQLFGEGLSASGFNNQVLQQVLQNANAGRVQGLNEQLGIRGNAFNELASLLGLQQVQAPSMQNFFAPSQVDFLGAQGLYQNQLNQNYQSELSRQNAAMGGLFGLGSALITGAGAAAGGGGTLLGGFK